MSVRMSDAMLSALLSQARREGYEAAMRERKRTVCCEACDREIDRDNPDECSPRPEGFFCADCTTHPEYARYLRERATVPEGGEA